MRTSVPAFTVCSQLSPSDRSRKEMPSALQAVIGRVEIDRAQGARDRLADGKVAERGMPAHPLQLIVGELDLELQLALPGNTHPQIPTQTASIARVLPRMRGEPASW